MKSPLKRGLKLCSAPVKTSVRVQRDFSMLKYWSHGALHSFNPCVCSTIAYAQKMHRFPSASILFFCGRQPCCRSPEKFAGTWSLLKKNTMCTWHLPEKNTMYVALAWTAGTGQLFQSLSRQPETVFPSLPRLHPVSVTRRQALHPCKVYGNCDWRHVAETECKRGRLGNKGTGFGISLHPLDIGGCVWRVN
jgi:hypothetical protein